jgi:hypothetical protein
MRRGIIMKIEYTLLDYSAGCGTLDDTDKIIASSEFDLKLLKKLIKEIEKDEDYQKVTRVRLVKVEQVNGKAHSNKEGEFLTIDAGGVTYCLLPHVEGE